MQAVWSQEVSEDQIGNNFFKTKRQNIRQFGGAVEAADNRGIVYAFINELFSNQIFYELRLYGLDHYPTLLPPQPPLVPEAINNSEVESVLGYGWGGVLGFNVIVNPNVSFLPFIKLQGLRNASVAYRDREGNSISSDDYSESIGAKLSLRVTDVFALSVQGIVGPQQGYLSGKGVFYATPRPKIRSTAATIDIDFPYKIDLRWSITPYIFYSTYWISTNANNDTINTLFSLDNLTSTEKVIGVKLGYVF